MACDERILKILSLVASGIAIGTLILAIATDFWVVTEEVREITNKNANVTEKAHGFSQQGLWRICFSCKEVNLARTCYYINKLSPENETLAQQYDKDFETVEISISLAKRIYNASVLVVSGFSVLVIAAAVSTIGNFKEDFRTLIGGVLFVVSGLTLIMALITYISGVNDEVHHHPPPNEDDKDGVGFLPAYNASFYIAGISFFCTKIAAVVCISLYFKRHRKQGNLEKIIPGLYKLEEKTKSDNNGSVKTNSAENTPEAPLPSPPHVVVGRASPTVIY